MCVLTLLWWILCLLRISGFVEVDIVLVEEDIELVEVDFDLVEEWQFVE